MIKVEINCSGYGQERWETVELSRDEIEQMAIRKLKETDASPRMQAIDVIIEVKA